MVELIVGDKYSPRKYTDAFYDYLIEIGEINEESALSNLLYWLSDDDVYEYARVNFDIEFIEEDDEDERGEF